MCCDRPPEIPTIRIGKLLRVPVLISSNSRAHVKSKEKQTLRAIDPAGQAEELKRIGGSQSDTWNNLIVGQAVQTLWTKKFRCGRAKPPI
jgi:hypothetical protein